jgi:WD40 repeat protein
VDTVDWSPDGSLLAAGTRDRTVIVWDAKSGKTLDTLTFELMPQSLHWRMTTRQLAIGLANADASPTKVYDYDKKRELFEVRGMRAAWSPGGQLLATGGGDGTVYIYADSGQQLAALQGHSRYVHKVVWRPDGRWFATASVDGFVIVWDAEERRQVARLQNPFALSLAWSIDGRALASGGGNQFVTVWDANSFSEIFKITQAETITGQTISGSGAAGYVLDVAWGPQGKTFIVSDRNGGVLIYSAGLLVSRTWDDWLATAEEQVQRGFSEEECRQFEIEK